MKMPRQLLVAAACFWAFAVPVVGQGNCVENAQTHQPCINKIDPPNWWPEFPDPMLLVHGANLDHAHWHVEALKVGLERSQVSANGHWAFLWLKTAHAASQTLWITAENESGSARSAFALKQRASDPALHRGLSSADALYLVMTDRFAAGAQTDAPAGDNRAFPNGWHGGNFAGLARHLDYLEQLGVTAVWLTPVDSNQGMKNSYHGYAATDLYAVDPHFGTLAEYQQLSVALHQRGMKLVFDMVPNHIGIHHPWVFDPPASGWLNGSPEHHSIVQNDFSLLADPHAPSAKTRGITDGWFTDEMPDLNQDNPLVRQYLIQNALWWVETAQLDAFRLDTFPYVGRSFWHDFDAALHAAYPHLTTVGEVFYRNPEVTSFFAGGRDHGGIDTGLDTLFDFPMFFTLSDVLAQDKPMTELAHVLARDSLYPHPERLISFVGNHDTMRFLTAAGGSTARLKLALGLVATLRGTPLLYSGDEIAMAGGNDPDDRHDFPGGFPGDRQDAFTAAGRTAKEQDVFAWISGLLKLRASHPALQSGMEQNLFADADGFVFVRSTSETGCAANPGGEKVLVLVNKAKTSRQIDLATDGTALMGCRQFRLLTPPQAEVPTFDSGHLHIRAPAESMLVFAAQ